jgi:arginine:ornithine antiporter/lysine permease
MKFLLLGFIIYAPGTILYFITRRELNKQLFTPAEWVLFGVAVVGCVVGIHGLATGYISI